MNKSSSSKLILGAAGASEEDGITVDNDPKQNPDVLHDLNETPWPFEDNQFGQVVCHHVLEHLENFTDVMKELHRITKQEGTIYIEVPHYSCWQANSPEHKLRFSYFSLDHYFGKKESWNQRDWHTTGFKFFLRKRELTFHRSFRRFQLHRIFNRSPLAYERFWTALFPAEHLKFWIQPLKT